MNVAKKIRLYKRYKNLEGKSTVLQYEIEKDAVNLRFSNNSAYRFTNQSAGPENIAKMKTLAQSGKGLDALVETLKGRYERKIR